MLTLIRDENKPSTSFLLYSFPLLHNLRIEKKNSSQDIVLYALLSFSIIALCKKVKCIKTQSAKQNVSSHSKKEFLSTVFHLVRSFGLEKRRRMANGGDRGGKKASRCHYVPAIVQWHHGQSAKTIKAAARACRFCCVRLACHSAS